MNWDAIGALGELIGALAVVVTVVYLSLQIRNESARAKREHRRDRVNRIANSYTNLADSEYMPQMVLKLGELSGAPTGWKQVSEETGLEPIEAIRYSFSRQGLLHSLQDALLDQSLEQSERDSVRLRLQYTIQQDGPAFVAFWKVLRPTFLPEFQKVLESILQEDNHT